MIRRMMWRIGSVPLMISAAGWLIRQLFPQARVRPSLLICVRNRHLNSHDSSSALT